HRARFEARNCQEQQRWPRRTAPPWCDPEGPISPCPTIGSVIATHDVRTCPSVSSSSDVSEVRTEGCWAPKSGSPILDVRTWPSVSSSSVAEVRTPGASCSSALSVLIVCLLWRLGRCCCVAQILPLCHRRVSRPADSFRVGDLTLPGIDTARRDVAEISPTVQLASAAAPASG